MLAGGDVGAGRKEIWWERGIGEGHARVHVHSRFTRDDRNLPPLTTSPGERHQASFPSDWAGGLALPSPSAFAAAGADLLTAAVTLHLQICCPGLFCTAVSCLQFCFGRGSSLLFAEPLPCCSATPPMPSRDAGDTRRGPYCSGIFGAIMPSTVPPFLAFNGERRLLALLRPRAQLFLAVPRGVGRAELTR